MLQTKEEVIDLVSRLIWLLSVKHSAVNYPVSDYGAFTPVLPTKIYNDSRVPPGTFSVLNLPNVNIALVSKTKESVNQSITQVHVQSLSQSNQSLQTVSKSNQTVSQSARKSNQSIRQSVS